ncbi:PP2C family protein-serine/threonine phosphatase [Mucilaginibacter ginkgonis]|uniref:PP2C family protein-serine/threonine phosphatase n=1 Tax=Mucilaginibacter ginkgonis TaxID=2682091 RepID=A0A6I4HXL0_9SPHI|nr:PP2C family protein-serine/threonine phosphatase [Mucilaginibacter ginkgonis]QQL49402.1 PP2C family protein-serine/threonine phosphatase [Mucilaginibacter ginkgonis]
MTRNKIPGQDELIELLLKRQSELNALLEITRAINKNTSTPLLVQMLEVILKNYLNVGRFRFLTEKNGTFGYTSKYGGKPEPIALLELFCTKLSKTRTPTVITERHDPVLKKYRYFIPFYHKSKVVACALIGEFDTSGEMLDNDLNFIQALINVIVVALENKKLLKERLQSARYQREMELAAEVQNMLVPIRSHKDETVQIGATYLPHNEIGGDYFDFIRLNKDEFLWCIADVSGKGISAALLMANFQAGLRAWATVDNDVSRVVQKLNKIVVDNTRGERFITLFVARYNQRTRQLNYVNAGHNPPVLFSNGKAEMLKDGTTMLGIFEDLPFVNEGVLKVEPDSLIFNYTDGLMDYELKNNQYWKDEHLLNFVSANGHLQPDDFNKVLMVHLQQVIRGKAIDDITLLTLRIF